MDCYLVAKVACVLCAGLKLQTVCTLALCLVCRPDLLFSPLETGPPVGDG